MTKIESNGIDIVTAIICDNIRFENTGKALLIGVYSSDIVQPEFPANFLVSYWVIANVLSLGTHDMNFRVMYNGEVLAKAKASIDAIGIGDTGIPMGQLPVHLKSSGTLSFQYRKNDDEEWETVVDKKVILNPESISSTEPSPPS